MATRCRSPPESWPGSLCKSAAMRSFSAMMATCRSMSSFVSPRSTRGKARLSRAVRWGKSARFWNTIARLRLAGGVAVMSIPPTSTCPRSGRTSPSRSRRIVLLPQLGGPKMQKNSLSSIRRSTSSTTMVVPKDLLTLRSSSVDMRAPPNFVIRRKGATALAIKQMTALKRDGKTVRLTEPRAKTLVGQNLDAVLTIAEMDCGDRTDRLDELRGKGQAKCWIADLGEFDVFGAYAENYVFVFRAARALKERRAGLKLERSCRAKLKHDVIAFADDPA